MLPFLVRSGKGAVRVDSSGSSRKRLCVEDVPNQGGRTTCSDSGDDSDFELAAPSVLSRQKGPSAAMAPELGHKPRRKPRAGAPKAARQPAGRGGRGGRWQGGRSSGSDSDSDNDFQLGTLVAVELHGGKTAVGEGPAGEEDWDADWGGAGGGPDGGVGGSVRELRIPARPELAPYARAVRPYRPRSAPALGKVLEVPDLLRADLSELTPGQKFLGVLLDPPLGFGARAGGPTGEPTITTLQLATLAGLIFVWTDKERIGEMVKVLYSWGGRLVESLNWVQAFPGRGFLGATAPPRVPLRTLHRTLLICRKGSGHIELLHQRTADVVVAPAEARGGAPDEARLAVETLLRDANRGGEPRLLELSWGGLGAERLRREGRAGWITIVQKNGLG